MSLTFTSIQATESLSPLQRLDAKLTEHSTIFSSVLSKYIGNCAMLTEIARYSDLPSWVTSSLIARHINKLHDSTKSTDEVKTISDFYDSELKEPINKAVGRKISQEILAWAKVQQQTVKLLKSFQAKYSEKIQMILLPTNGPEIFVARDQDTAAMLAASFIKEFAAFEGFSATKNITFATGNTMLGVYQHLGQINPDFTKILATHLDEYAGTNTFKEEIEQHWKNLKIPESHWNSINGTEGDLDKEVKRIASLHDAYYRLNVSSLALLGIGPSQSPHIAFNDNQREPFSFTRINELSEETQKRDLLRTGTSFKQALTLGTLEVLRHTMIATVLFGADKAQGLAASLQLPFPEYHPASILQLAQGRAVIFIDSKAALRLQKITDYKTIL